MKNLCKQIENWNLIIIKNAEVKEKALSPKRAEDLLKLGYAPIKAKVPGNFELDLIDNKLIPDLYYGQNVAIAQKLENLHLYYYSEFDYVKSDEYDNILTFEGIDTAAEIFIDGKFLAFTENMHHAHRFDLSFLEGEKHNLFVHVLPTSVYARDLTVPAMCFGLRYNHDFINVRKAPYMAGWDIMPRIVSGGIYKRVTITRLPKSRIENAFTYTKKISSDKASLFTTFDVLSNEDFLTDFSAKITISGDNRIFEKTIKIFSKHQRVQLDIENPLLWWPKNYGRQNMYDVTISLYKDSLVQDEVFYKHGIRTVFLKRTSSAGAEGDFCFVVNGMPIFCLGTNWVPTDAFPSRHTLYDRRGLDLIKSLDCNMVRCWGGNTYPDEKFYDYCDENGIMVWQDFSFGCGHYPSDGKLCALTEEEVKQIVLKYRNHPSLMLYAGDNECDAFIVDNYDNPLNFNVDENRIDPNLNKITRDVILRTLRDNDATRPYLPSSPYIDEYAFFHGNPSENHLWGPRDYFKGDFYKNAKAHFASEIGYHGCPSPKSLEKFIAKKTLDDFSPTKICNDKNWLAHATEPNFDTEDLSDAQYSYRIPLMVKQVGNLFTQTKQDLDGFTRQSQISQAEALKYFIERFRSLSPKTRGILWWNIIDGWPQISDAIVDWYGTKKLAYHYVKRAQQPFTMIVTEPEDGVSKLIATNLLRQTLSVDYTVKDVANDVLVCAGNFQINPDENITLEKIPVIDHGFLLIEWNVGLFSGVNHYAFSLDDKWDYEKYLNCMKKAGFYDEFEGF